MKVEVELSKEYERLFRGINVKGIVEKSLKQALSSEFKKCLFINLLKELSYKQKSQAPKLSQEEFPKGKINKKGLRKVSEDIKQGIARRHGLS
jgi:hypothetical protein